MLKWLNKQLKNDLNKKLIFGFFIYLGLMFAFAQGYYCIYKDDTNSFFFLVDIKTSKSKEFASEANHEVNSLSQWERFIEQAIVSMRKDPKNLQKISTNSATTLNCPGAGELYSHDNWRVLLPERKYLVLSQVEQLSIIATMHYPRLLSVRDSEDNPIICWRASGPEYWPGVNASIFKEIETQKELIVSKLSEINQRLHTIPSENPDIWSFWDFFYFSVITQGTVGYGDILPNSTKVRELVVFQVILGYLVIIVIINMAFVGDEKPAVEAESDDQK